MPQSLCYHDSCGLQYMSTQWLHHSLRWIKPNDHQSLGDSSPAWSMSVWMTMSVQFWIVLVWPTAVVGWPIYSRTKQWAMSYCEILHFSGTFWWSFFQVCISCMLHVLFYCKHEWLEMIILHGETALVLSENPFSPRVIIGSVCFEQGFNLWFGHIYGVSTFCLSTSFQYNSSERVNFKWKNRRLPTHP